MKQKNSLQIPFLISILIITILTGISIVDAATLQTGKIVVYDERTTYSIQEGETSTFLVNGREYNIQIDRIIDYPTPSVRFLVDGKRTGTSTVGGDAFNQEKTLQIMVRGVNFENSGWKVSFGLYRLDPADTTAPSITINSPIQNSNYPTDEISLNILCTDEHNTRIQYTIDGETTMHDYTEPTILPKLTNGSHTIHIQCNDDANNIATQQATFSLTQKSAIVDPTELMGSTTDYIHENNAKNYMINNKGHFVSIQAVSRDGQSVQVNIDGSLISQVPIKGRLYDRSNNIVVDVCDINYANGYGGATVKVRSLQDITGIIQNNAACSTICINDNECEANYVCNNPGACNSQCVRKTESTPTKQNTYAKNCPENSELINDVCIKKCSWWKRLFMMC